ncbi:hypothetical protein FOA52_014980 [Chlamydomonas sp. UWO 241]|nr:hypothetical protein FOA52_014980 [Chlamydomonas sp. UWO 241]
MSTPEAIAAIFAALSISPAGVLDNKNQEELWADNAWREGGLGSSAGGRQFVEGPSVPSNTPSIEMLGSVASDPFARTSGGAASALPDRSSASSSQYGWDADVIHQTHSMREPGTRRLDKSLSDRPSQHPEPMAENTRSLMASLSMGHERATRPRSSASGSSTFGAFPGRESSGRLGTMLENAGARGASDSGVSWGSGGWQATEGITKSPSVTTLDWVTALAEALPAAADAAAAAPADDKPVGSAQQRPNVLPDVAMCDEDIATARSILAVATAGGKFSSSTEMLQHLLNYSAADAAEFASALAESGCSLCTLLSAYFHNLRQFCGHSGQKDAVPGAQPDQFPSVRDLKQQALVTVMLKTAVTGSVPPPPASRASASSARSQAGSAWQAQAGGRDVRQACGRRGSSISGTSSVPVGHQQHKHQHQHQHQHAARMAPHHMPMQLPMQQQQQSQQHQYQQRFSSPGLPPVSPGMQMHGGGAGFPGTQPSASDFATQLQMMQLLLNNSAPGGWQMPGLDIAGLQQQLQVAQAMEQQQQQRQQQHRGRFLGQQQHGGVAGAVAQQAQQAQQVQQAQQGQQQGQSQQHQQHQGHQRQQQQLFSPLEQQMQWLQYSTPPHGHQ